LLLYFTNRLILSVNLSFNFSHYAIAFFVIDQLSLSVHKDVEI